MNLYLEKKNKNEAVKNVKKKIIITTIIIIIITILIIIKIIITIINNKIYKSKIKIRIIKGQKTIKERRNSF